jgi:hypothetical protein
MFALRCARLWTSNPSTSEGTDESCQRILLRYSYDLNRIEFQMDNEHSYLKVSGFDPNRQVVIRAKFEEVSSGTDNSDN